ncbi:hypothetical protein IC617_06365 [Neiella sp. HB171785]|uniref:UrcA family protein n=1 Tax=Neiella litorisoli TaxID=2771431 RepID=A0A8J6QI70_9GAMM|nr:hypothetical protein [Neiella litorisoli]MBD1389048.1 hypothetical protein [Neiella litorisoli]
MFKSYCKRALIVVLTLVSISSLSVLAEQQSVRAEIESFAINGLSLNTSIDALQELLKADFKCKVNRRGDVDHWHCRGIQQEQGKPTLKIGVATSIKTKPQLLTI